MFQLGYSAFLLYAFAWFAVSVNGQSLKLKCPNNDWSQNFGRCYQVVNYNHSYSKALSYCQKYGARLAEPVGYVVNKAVGNLVQQAIPAANMYRIGYRYTSAGANPATGAIWSDKRGATVDGGIWGRRQPDLGAGLCAHVQYSSLQWFMGDCESLMPFVCEIDPCPENSDTFMCNGKCIGRSLVCDGKDDCGNNLDEQNCMSECTFTYHQNSGTLTLPTTNNQYAVNMDCTWTIISEPGSRINVKFDSFLTEETADVLEVYDGSFVIGESQLVMRLSGATSRDFTTSYNFLVLRFVSDSKEQRSGFTMHWSTDHECVFDVVSGFTLSNMEIQTGSLPLGSKVTVTKCQSDCANGCLGFSYDRTRRICYFFNQLPILQEDSGFDLHTKTCPSFTTIRGSVPVFEPRLTATSSTGQLSTPLYPRAYTGNMELEYVITTAANNLITLQAVTVDLCYGDYVNIYDKTHDLLETLTSDSEPHYILSTGNTVYVRMVLERHWRCNGVLLEYKQGCDLTFTGTGKITAPGNGTSKSYPPLMMCTWVINAPSSDRSVTLRFDDFNLEAEDSLTLVRADGTSSQHTGTELQGQSITTPGHMTMTMTTSSQGNNRGFSLSFSPGCPSLLSLNYVLSVESFNYGDKVEVACADGHSFAYPYQGINKLVLTCQLGGMWDFEVLPVCARAFCGIPGSIGNGYVVSSSGVQGGQMTTYACNDGFTLAGSSSISCEANETWTMKPFCTSPRCQAIETVVTGVNSPIVLGDGRSHGSVAQLSCIGHEREIIGAETVQCNQGNWDFSQTGVSQCQNKPCGIPMIDNAFLTPAMPYYAEGQEIAATCHEGYELSGSRTFRCGTTSLPTCNLKTCSLDRISNLLVVGSSATLFTYGNSVSVTCDDGYEFRDATTTSVTLTCLDTGAWDRTPACRQKSCGEPYQVGGSTYIGNNCLDHGCSFRFGCRSKYELLGASSASGNTTVTCGAVRPGMWDFGNLHCMGGQCPDPGYPASGSLIADSFQEGSVATFGCNDNGYTPVNSNGSPSTGITCVYNGFRDIMEWDGEVPTCNDTTKPIIWNCPGPIVVINNLQAPGFLEPYATDNTAVMSFTRTPVNFKPNQNISSSQHISYKATDYAGNTHWCQFTISIPNYVDCYNYKSTVIKLPDSTSGFTTLNTRDYSYFYGVVGVIADYKPVTAQLDSSLLTNVTEVDISAFDSTSGQALDTCTIQFRFQAEGCATWPLKMPHTITNCAANLCTLQCENGYYFMNNPGSTSIQMSCTNGNWDRTPPTCALATENYVRYSIYYNYKYSISGVVSAQVCESVYEPQVRANLEQFAIDMAAGCNQNAGANLITITSGSFTLTFETDGNTQVGVRFQFIISLADETADNSQTLKQACSSAIQNKLNQQVDLASINSINGQGSMGCGGGTFLTAVTTEVYQFTCYGDRKYFNTRGGVCLECPVGKYFDNVNDDCADCPVGTYGSGTICQPCPNGAGPGIAGLKRVEDCSKRAICPKGTFSDTGLAPCTPCPRHFYNPELAGRTCAECLNNQITANKGSVSIDACITKEVAVSRGVTTPCTNNPCINGGTCFIERHDFLCTCPTGYTGTQCETEISPCDSKPCKNEQSCSIDPFSEDGFTCGCNLDSYPGTELTGKYCQFDNFGCYGQCQNNATCHNQLGNYLCKCPTYGGYKGIGVCNIPRDQCTDNPCVNGECVAHDIYYRSCDCNPGYEGLDCSINIDDCNPDMCQNGGTCVDGVDSFNCECADGYHGNLCQFRRACEVECSGAVTSNCHRCSSQGTCLSTVDSYTCICLSDYTGLTCDVRISRCNSYPCQHNGTCLHLSADQYRCECLPPWTGVECKVQVNHCPNGDQCYNGGTCYSTPDGYRCRCPHNFIGDDCSVVYDLCARANPCLAGGACSVTEEGMLSCSCTEGYAGDYCERELPTCTSTTCVNGGTCRIASGQVTCSCVPGYEGSTCETNINDCMEASCSQYQQCVDGVNGFSCVCAPGRWGQVCDKEVGVDFDYVIQPKYMDRAEASINTFGDGVTVITGLSVAFWIRLTKEPLSDVALLNVYGSNSDDMMIPKTSNFTLEFYTSRVISSVEEPQTRRRKREVGTMGYGNVNIADGFWHHIAVAWTSNPGEIDIWVDGVFTDQVVFARGQNIGTRGFIVFGAFDTVMGTSDPATSFEGRISQLYIVLYKLQEAEIRGLFDGSTTLTNSLSHETTLMLQYPVVYDSELTNGVCLPSDNACQGLHPGATVPTKTVCPVDTIRYTERGGVPVWPEPSFSGATAGTVISNYENNGTQMDWGVYGIGYAAFDGSGSAGVCSFRLYNYKELPCDIEEGGNAPSSVNVAGGKRYSPQCGSGEDIAGDAPLYQMCNMYSMWNKDIQYNYRYVYPVCTATSTLTVQTSISLEVQVTGGSCTSLLSDYKASVLTALSSLDNDLSGKLCPTNCNAPVNEEAAFQCQGSSLMIVNVDLGLLESTMMYEGSSITAEEAVRLAVGDLQVFHYNNANGLRASPVISSINIASATSCVEGREVGGDSCVRCGAGTWWSSAAMLCERCDVGSYRSPASDNYNNCELCHVSSTTVSDGSTQASFCKAKCQTGLYNAQGSNTCTPCAVGFYQDVVGAFSCKPCTFTTTTATSGSNDPAFCVAPGSLTTTTTGGPLPDVGAATENTGVSIGVIVAIVLAVLIVVTIVLLILCFCCCRDILPCFKKHKQIVAPSSKDGYYANKYGQHNMQFVSYNLRDVREKKGRPLDRQPIVENPLSDETGSVKTDISVHVPVFNEKLDGKITRKSLYMSNGGQNLNTSRTRSVMSSHEPTPRGTYEQPITSSPRGTHYDEVEEDRDDDRKHRSKKRRRRHRKERSEERSHRSAHRHGDRGERSHRSRSVEQMENDYDEIPMATVPSHLPKALAPMPHRIKSMPPSDIHLRPLSPLSRPRAQVQPNEYQDFLEGSPSRSPKKSNFMSRPYDDDDDNDSGETPVQRIEVESDEDLR